jgi:hypothetical protein
VLEMMTQTNRVVSWGCTTVPPARCKPQPELRRSLPARTRAARRQLRWWC